LDSAKRALHCAVWEPADGSGPRSSSDRAGHRCVQLQGPWRDEPPGAHAALTGTRNAETTTLIAPSGLRCRRSGASVAATRYAEIEPDTGVLAEHTVDWLAGCPPVTRHPLGGGSVLHCGTGLNDAVLEWLWREHLSREHHQITQLGRKALALPCEIAQPGSVAALFGRAEEELAAWM
jgi:hypothetical protein